MSQSVKTGRNTPSSALNSDTKTTTKKSEDKNENDTTQLKDHGKSEKNSKLSLKSQSTNNRGGIENEKNSNEKIKETNGDVDKTNNTNQNKNKEKGNHNNEKKENNLNQEKIINDDKKTKDNKSDEKPEIELKTNDSKKTKDVKKSTVSDVVKDNKKEEKDEKKINGDDKKIRESPRSKIDETKDNKKTPKKGSTDTQRNNETDVGKAKEKIVWDNEEMESLVVEDMDTVMTELSPKKVQPVKPTTGRVLRLKSGVQPSQTRSNPNVTESTDKTSLSNASTIVNLSMGSDLTTDKSPERNYARAIRAVSGRRSVRQIRDSNYQNLSQPEFYRKLNDSTLSMNATVGSEINYDSVRTPTISMFSRKRERNADSEIEQIVDDTESPKKMRLDFSGFLGFVATPMTMLRDRLARLQSSTPNSKTSQNDDINPEDVTIDVDELPDLDQPKSDKSNKEEDDDDVVIVEPENDDKQTEKDILDLKTPTEKTQNETIVPTVETSRRRLCNLM